MGITRRPAHADPVHTPARILPSIQARGADSDSVINRMEGARDNVSSDDYSSMLARAQESY